MRPYHSQAVRSGLIAWETDIVLVTAACQWIAMCGDGAKLRAYAAKLAKEQLSAHDRQLIGAVYLAKKKVLVESGGWHSTDVILSGLPTDGLVT